MSFDAIDGFAATLRRERRYAQRRARRRDGVVGCRRRLGGWTAAAQTRTGALAPQAQTLWLLTRNCRTNAKIAAFEWLGEDIALDIGEGERAFLPPLGAPRGKTRLWLARSTFAQPAIDAGAGIAVAEGAALALAGDEPPQMWNAGGPAPMRANLSAIDVDTRQYDQGRRAVSRASSRR